MLIAFCWPNLVLWHHEGPDIIFSLGDVFLDSKETWLGFEKTHRVVACFLIQGFFLRDRISSWDPRFFAQGSGPVYVVIANMKLVASPNLHWVQRTGHYEILQLFVGFGNEDFIIWVWSLTQQQWLVPGSLHFGCGLSQGPSHVWWTKIIATRSDDGPTILHTCSGRVVEHQFMM